jgi:putative ABC transport system permease protein
MKIGATIRVAFRALRRNKMRSALTMLGIVIGVAAVITSVGIGNGAKSQVEAQIATLGENMVLIFSGSFSPGGVRGGWGGAGLKIDDAVSVAREVPGIVGVSPEIRSWSQIMAGGRHRF